MLRRKRKASAKEARKPQIRIMIGETPITQILNNPDKQPAGIKEECISNYKETVYVNGWEERLFEFCTKAIIPVVILWAITGIIGIVLNLIA